MNYNQRYLKTLLPFIALVLLFALPGMALLVGFGGNSTHAALANGESPDDRDTVARQDDDDGETVVTVEVPVTVEVTRIVTVVVTPTATPMPPTPTPLPPNMTYSEEMDYPIGPADAPVIFVEFSDYRCPYCGRFATETRQPLIDHYGDLVRFIFRDFPVFGGESVRAAQAAKCAYQQDNYWAYHTMIFEDQIGPKNPLSDENLMGFAQTLGLDMDQFEVCFNDELLLEEMVTHFIDANSMVGGEGVPAFLINGKIMVGAHPFETFKQVIDAELIAQGVQPPG